VLLAVWKPTSQQSFGGAKSSNRYFIGSRQPIQWPLQYQGCVEWNPTRKTVSAFTATPRRKVTWPSQGTVSSISGAALNAERATGTLCKKVWCTSMSVWTPKKKKFPIGELIEQHKHFDQDGVSRPRIKPRITKRRSYITNNYVTNLILILLWVAV